jgi:putative sterol carrier protein
MMKIILIAIITVQSIYSTSFAADVFVSLNKSNGSKIDQATVVKLLKAEKLIWENGNSVVLVIDDLTAIDSNDFDAVLGMSKSQFLEFWRIKFFSGRALLPKQVKNSGTVLELLHENSNSVYIRIGQRPDNKISEDPDLKSFSFKF